MKVIEVLEASLREKTGKSEAKKIRHKDYIPVELYGKNIPNKHLMVNYEDFEHIFKTHRTNRPFTLKIDNEEYKVVIKDFQIHPITRKFIHADLQVVKDDEDILVKVPVEFVGTPVGLAKGGIVRRYAWEVRIKVKGKDIPDTLKVDISNLDIDDILTVGDIRGKVNYRIEEPDELLLVGVVAS